MIGNHDIVELKGNFIPKGLVPLEILFSKDDTILKPTIQSIEENILSYNNGSKREPKMINISKTLSERKETSILNYWRNLLIFFLGHMNIWKHTTPV